MLIKKICVFAMLATVVTSTFAQTANEDEKKAYCQHARDEAEAERTLDTGVEAIGRLGQSDSNPTVKQAVIGVTKSVSKHLQGNSAVRAAVMECELYGRTLDLQHIVKYKMARIDRVVAEARVRDLENLLAILDEEIASAEKRTKSGNATITDVFSLRQQRLQSYGQLIAAKSDVTGLEIPEVPNIDVDEAMKDVDDITLRLQTELNHKQELQTWDVTLIGGVQKPISGQPVGSSSGYRPFASVNFTYNLNSSAYKSQLAASTSSLMELRKQQNDELAHQVSAFKKAALETVDAQKQLLPDLTSQIRSFATQMNALGRGESVAAARMRTQLRIGLAMAAMEEHLVNLKITLLSK
ncbi:hypothetical protein [Caballeronia glebae]|uniref:hypothetical protein n=1 Tax=Caballeronia glebae TaxID=1777143 RepID=UPI0038B70C87